MFEIWDSKFNDRYFGYSESERLFYVSFDESDASVCGKYLNEHFVVYDPFLPIGNANKDIRIGIMYQNIARSWVHEMGHILMGREHCTKDGDYCYTGNLSNLMTQTKDLKRPLELNTFLSHSQWLSIRDAAYDF